MRIGISSWSYPWAVGVPGSLPPRPLTALELLDRASALGVAVVQVADNLPLHRMTPHERARVRAHADELGLALEVGTLGLTSEHLGGYLGIAQEMSSSLLRVVIDTPTAQPSHDEIVTTLRGAMPAFEDAGVDLLIENHDRFPAQVLADLVAEVDSDRLGICFDTVNSLGCVESPETVFEVLRHRVRNVHVKDFHISRTDNRMGFIVSGAPVGQGALDVQWLVREVHALPPTVTLVLELWPPRRATITDTLAKEQEWVAQSIAHLQDSAAGLAPA